MMTAAPAPAMRDTVSSMPLFLSRAGSYLPKSCIFLSSPSLPIFIVTIEPSRLWYRYAGNQETKADLLWEQDTCADPIQANKKGGQQRGLWETISLEHRWSKGHSYHYHSHIFQQFKEMGVHNGNHMISDAATQLCLASARLRPWAELLLLWLAQGSFSLLLAKLIAHP